MGWGGPMAREALADGVHSADVVLDILARRREPGPPLTIMTPDALEVGQEPVADCARPTYRTGQPEESALMERTENLAVPNVQGGPVSSCSACRLPPLHPPGDEIVATAIKRQHEPPRLVGDLLAPKT